MNEPLLQVKNLRKYFPVTAGIFKSQVGEVKALDGVDFTVHKGEVLGLVGESGSGKSTAARVALRLIEPTGGEISWMGHDLMKMDRKGLLNLRQEAQIVFQDPYASLNPRRPIVESIGEGMLFHGLVKTEKEKRERVAEILESVGLSPDVMDRYPHQFSGGQQQRICIGRAIAMDPKLIICDEALSALDVSVQAQILNLLGELKEKLGLSYLFISHDLSTVRFLCDRVVVLYLGKVMEEASTEDLFSNPRHPYTQALLSATPKDHPHAKDKRIILKGEIPSPLNPPSGCPFRTRCPHAQAICAQSVPKKELPDGHRYDCIL
jgi:oligopeptide/dipeptide ABC transporter ATP-binding protein